MMELKQRPTGYDYSQEYLENLLLNIAALGTTVRGRTIQQNISAMLKNVWIPAGSQ